MMPSVAYLDWNDWPNAQSNPEFNTLWNSVARITNRGNGVRAVIGDIGGVRGGIVGNTLSAFADRLLANVEHAVCTSERWIYDVQFVFGRDHCADATAKGL